MRTGITSVAAALSVGIEFRFLTIVFGRVSVRSKDGGGEMRKKVGNTDRVSLHASH